MSHPIRKSIPEDWEGIHQLLAAADLPAVSEAAHGTFFFVIDLQGEVVACGGYELLGGCALLKSLAVDAQYRQRGMGGALVDHISASLEAQGIANVYLLTVDKTAFFEHHGFKEIPRASAPSFVQDHEQFQRLCPDTAHVLVKQLA